MKAFAVSEGPLDWAEESAAVSYFVLSRDLPSPPPLSYLLLPGAAASS